MEIEESHERGHWWLKQIRFIAPAMLRAGLGLAEPDAARQAYLDARSRPLGHPALSGKGEQEGYLSRHFRFPPARR